MVEYLLWKLGLRHLILHNIHNLQTLMDWTFSFVILLLHFFMVKGPNKDHNCDILLGQWFKAIGRHGLYLLVPMVLGCLPHTAQFQSTKKHGKHFRKCSAEVALTNSRDISLFCFFRVRYQPLSSSDIIASYLKKNTIKLLEKPNESAKFSGELILLVHQIQKEIFIKSRRLSIPLFHEQETEPFTAICACPQALTHKGKHSRPCLTELYWWQQSKGKQNYDYALVSVT